MYYTISESLTVIPLINVGSGKSKDHQFILLCTLSFPSPAYLYVQNERACVVQHD